MSEMDVLVNYLEDKGLKLEVKWETNDYAGYYPPFLPHIIAKDVENKLFLFYQLLEKINDTKVKDGIYNLELAKAFSKMHLSYNSVSFIVIPQQKVKGFEKADTAYETLRWFYMLCENLGYGILLIHDDEVRQIKPAVIDEFIEKKKIYSMETSNKQKKTHS
jgi:hypothetical protein